MQQDTVNLAFAGAPALAPAGLQANALPDTGGTSLWLNERLLPAYAAALSLLVLVLGKLLPGGTAPDKDPDAAKIEAGFIARRGGWTIFAFKLLRLAAVLALLALSAAVALSAHPLAWSCAPYLAPLIYASFLALANAFAAAPAAAAYSRHLTLVTLAIFAVYAYRDLWPLMTFNARPADGAEGALLWIKISLAAFAGVLEPLLEPYPYLPLDPKDATPNPEQTASIASFLHYVFLDPLMWRASRVPHLSHSELPPLPQKESVARVLARSAGALDPAETKRRHLFFAFLRVFRAEFAQEVAVVLVQAAVRLAGPVGVNQLLRYLENKEEAYAAPVRVRPWVWILWLALGPVADTLLGQLQQYISYTVVVRTEALVTARVFEHALRIRLTASPSPTSSAANSGAAEEKKQHLVGRINNLVTGDLAALSDARDVLALAVLIPTQVALGTWFLYSMLGWSVFVGMALMVALAPVPAKFASLIGDVTKEKMQATDARVQAVTEVMSVLRMIKLFGWRPLAERTIAAKRDAELRLIWRSRIIGFANFFVNHSIPLVHMIATYLVFTLVMKRNLTASIVFSSMTAFKILRNSLFQILDVVPTAMTTKVSLERLADFLWNTELLDAFDATPAPAPPAAHAHDIGFAHAEFLWSKAPSSPPSTTAASASAADAPFRLRVDTPVVFARGALNLVVGPTGAGKTSVLMALLGEMHCVPRPGGWVGLPREGGVAYAAQESWVRSATIKENIVLDQPFDEERYKKVLYQCALRQDLKLLEADDETEVGERGLTLSGGQKARVTLARAVYSKAEILLLDDVFAALDVHTSRWIADQCLAGDLLKGRTVILVTHNVALTMSLAHFVVALGADGTIAKQGAPAEVFAGDPALAERVRHEQQALELDALEEHEGAAKTDAPAKEGKLVVAEEIAVGRVSWKAIKMFLAALGGDWPVVFWTQVFIGLGVSEFFDVVEMWWLGRWAHQYAIQPHDQVQVTFYLIVYCVIIVSVVLASTWGTLFWTYGATGASRRLNADLMSSLLRSTFRWLDVTPVSRVINRFDGPVQGNLYVFFIVTANMLIKLTAVIVYTPVFLVPALFAVAVGALFGHMYVRAQMSVKRELSNAKSPVIGVFSGAMDGLVSIRAYHAQEFFRAELLQRIDYYSCAARVFNNLQRWISVRIDMLSAVFSSAVAFYLVYGGSISDSATVGFILTVAVTFTEMVLWCVQMYNGFEVNANSLERIYQYLHIEHEPSSGIIPPAYWPASGALHVEKLTARYSQDGPEILHGLTFTVNAGERVGIVGRTGSGKSTLTLALLRCIPTEGLVTFDGIPTATLDLDALRSAVTIIPQMPELMSGSLRHNLDPFGQHDDATLHDALRASGLANAGSANEGSNLGLDSQIAERGANLSVGQRQIVALARAIVRRSKLLILDEATSAIDYETDAIIQRSLRNELKDVTVITVAHRLQTIMDYDKIMVLDAGHLAEFDTPKALLEKKDGLLHALVEESSDKAALYAMAGAG
ncbi:multidrug resistance-associated ABC transporter [Phanerochaete sordida]|uniref:Multidrug resistance-associated ABC transporter n=1 Tax=Phanerochaete sordida TaxID=48140 RepID=A0A9P3GKP6_9APHY|nr:multidrug resistance-associated ABC transporter [Phanerochaete sordida]